MSEGPIGFYLPVDWHLKPWLRALPPGMWPAWVLVLTHVCMMGNRRGSCRAIPADLFGRTYGIGADAAERLIAAAVAAGALAVDRGRWTITEYQQYQSPETEKKRRRRAQARVGEAGLWDDLEGQEAFVPDNEPLSVADGQPPLPPDGPSSPQHSPSPPITPQHPSQARRQAMRRPSLEEVQAEMRRLGMPEGSAERFMAHYGTTGWRVGRAGLPMKNWRSACVTWQHKYEDDRRKGAAKGGSGPASGTVQDMGRAAMEAIYGPG